MPDANFVDTRSRIRAVQFEHVWPSLSSLFNDAGLVSSSSADSLLTERCRIYPETVTAVLNSSFSEPRTVFKARPQGDAVVWIDNGDTVTRNNGVIFKENDLTKTLKDIEVAQKVGVPFTVIRAVRKGQPNWRFRSVIDRFSRVFSYNPDEIRSNFYAAIARLQRTSSPITRFNPYFRQGRGMYFGLSDPQNTDRTPLGEPYPSGRWIHVLDWESAPLVSSRPNTLSLNCDDSAYWLHLSVRNGRVAVTMDNREAGPASYDYVLGTQSGTESGSDGDFRIDEFDYTNNASMSLEDLESFCYFGFTRPAVSVTPGSPPDTVVIRVHPNAVRICAIDVAAQVSYSFEKVGDVRTGDLKIDRASERALGAFKTYDGDPAPIR